MTRFGLLSLVVVAAPNAAWACGGFFCDGGGPTRTTAINQNAERIVFVRDTAANEVSAYIQIRYEGDPVDFAWVVPVVSRPALDVADPGIFDALDQATAPVFIFPGPTGGGGGGGGGGSGFGCGGAMASSDRELAGGDDSADGDADADDTGVNVWGQGGVGSYETAIITADDSADLTRWLGENDYAVPPEAEPVIASYVAEGSFFVAIRLQADANVDTLEPLVIRYQGDEPCVPLRLTQVAATDNMGVLVWIVGDEQAYPYNYARALVDDDDVVLNPADRTTNYLDLLSGAVDAAGGQAFITEFAQPTSTLPDLSLPSGSYYGGYFEGSVEAEEIVRSGRYITRMYTEIDPQDMTLDPIFQFDADLTDVSNIHDFTQPSAAAGIAGGNVRYASVGAGLAPLALALGIGWRRRVQKR